MNMTPNIPQLLTTVVGFLILVWIMKKYAWGPILDLLDRQHAHRASVLEQHGDQQGRQEAQAVQQQQDAEEVRDGFPVHRLYPNAVPRLRRL